MPTPDQHLSLAILRAYDPGAKDTGLELRFCCPLPDCAGQPIDKAHRTLCVNSRTGLYKCQRCSKGGKVFEKWDDRPVQTRQMRNQAALRRFSAPPPPIAVPTPKPTEEWDACLRDAVQIGDGQGRENEKGKPAVDYLASRGIPFHVAWEAGVQYHPSWIGLHEPCVVFSIVDGDGEQVAAQCRSITTNGRRTAGSLSCGIFMSHPAAVSMKSVLITEAPIDALSISAAGYAAVALCGTAIRPYLLDMLFGKTLLLAVDADEAGDKAAELWTKAAALSGAKVQRVRPIGGKDWNEILMTQGADAITAQLARYEISHVVRSSRVPPVAALPKSILPTPVRPPQFRQPTVSRDTPLEYRQ